MKRLNSDYNQLFSRKEKGLLNTNMLLRKKKKKRRSREAENVVTLVNGQESASKNLSENLKYKALTE